MSNQKPQNLQSNNPDWFKEVSEKIESAMRDAVSAATSKGYEGPTLSMFAKELAKRGVSMVYQPQDENNKYGSIKYGYNGDYAFGGRFKKYLENEKQYSFSFLNESNVNQSASKTKTMKAYYDAFLNDEKLAALAGGGKQKQMAKTASAAESVLSAIVSKSNGKADKAPGKSNPKSEQPESPTVNETADKSNQGAANNNVTITGEAPASPVPSKSKPAQSKQGQEQELEVDESQSSKKGVEEEMDSDGLTPSQKRLQQFLGRVLDKKLANQFVVRLPPGFDESSAERKYGESYIHKTTKGQVHNFAEKIVVSHGIEKGDQAEVARIALYAALEKGWDINTLKIHTKDNPKLQEIYEIAKLEIIEELKQEVTNAAEVPTAQQSKGKVTNEVTIEKGESSFPQQSQEKDHVEASAKEVNIPETGKTQVFSKENSTKDQESLFGKLHYNDAESRYEASL